MSFLVCLLFLFLIFMIYEKMCFYEEIIQESQFINELRCIVSFWLVFKFQFVALKQQWAYGAWILTKLIKNYRLTRLFYNIL